MRPYLSPTGDRIAFTSDRAAGVADIYVRPLAGQDAEERLLVKSASNKFVSDWSPDGRFLVYGSTDRRSNTDLWLLPLDEPSTPSPLLTSRANEVEAQISPDGKWIAYSSDESGTWQVYVRPFPKIDQAPAVALGGGVEPHWRHDGRELFFLTTDGRLMVVGIKPGPTFEAGSPNALFRTPVTGVNVYINQYTVSPDGQRFLIDAGERSVPMKPITLMVNWTALLRP
jgi:Tol biopolymer transport system component